MENKQMLFMGGIVLAIIFFIIGIYYIIPGIYHVFASPHYDAHTKHFILFVGLGIISAIFAAVNRPKKAQ